MKPNTEKTLEAFLEGVTPDQVGGEWEWGEDVGLEVISEFC